MRVPLSWLKEFVEIDLTIAELAHQLTMAGLEVESIDYLGVEGAELPWDADKVVVGAVLEVTQHPNADRLVLAQVDYGAAEPHIVVTGAPNLLPYRGQGPLARPLKAVYAKEGAELYDGHAEGLVKVKLKGRPVRGVMSDAMLCSEKELGISDEHEGILILPDEAPVGLPLRDYLGDVVLDIAITPNVARALSILGVAREVAALTGKTVRMPELPLQAAGPSIVGRAQVTVETPELCPRFTLALAEGVSIGPAPLWMQRRLTLAGMRPINVIVDISNYVMLELGGPNHIFDADKVADQHLVIRPARPGEQLTTLDGKPRDLNASAGGGSPPLLVCDPHGPSSLAGVMGGQESEVSPQTSRVLVEVAIWETTTIRKTAQALKLQSEASRRFERGVDYELPPLIQRRVLSLLEQLAGATVAQGLIDAYAHPWQTVVLDLPADEVTRIVGITLDAAAIADLLRPLGFGCETQGDRVRVTVPSFRRDVTILADLCEEVARMYGYDRIPTRLISDILPEQHSSPKLELEQKVRDILAGAGLDEMMTHSLTGMAQVARVNPTEADPTQYVRLANPQSPEREYMRRSLLPSLLEALTLNLRERERVLLFEIGRVYWPRPAQLLPDEPTFLALGLAGHRSPTSWHSGEATPLDFFDLKGVIETLVARLNLAERVRFVPLTDDPRFHPGRAARLEVFQPGGKPGQTAPGTPIGLLGELHPELRSRLGLAVPRATAAEIDLTALIGLAQPNHYTPISRFPPTSQDLAIVIGQEVPAERVEAAIRKYAGAGLESLLLFDLYEGPQVGAGKRSLAYRLTFRAADRTLSDADLAKVRAKIIRGLEYDLKASIRA